jgi:two-component system, LytTR family, sensor kinase
VLSSAENKKDMSSDIADKKSPFWTVQITGWTIFMVLVVGVLLTNETVHWTTVVSSTSNVLLGFIVTSLFRHFIRLREWANRNLRRLWLPLLMGCLTSALIWTAATVGVHFSLGSYTPEHKADMTTITFLIALLNNYFIVILWSLLYFAYHFFEIGQTARIARYKSEAAARDAQLNTLKGQINPHFMFNSLNNIRALMLEDVPRAREMVTKLSELLRYSMMHSEDKEVTLKEEISVVVDFLELCKIQYEHRLNYEITIDPETEGFRIPPMIIQILVENSVKHGISSRLEGGNVWVAAHREGDNLVMEVSNSGEWVHTTERKVENSGIGLPNIRRRLQLIYGEAATMLLRQEESRVVARITIPV